MPLRESEGGRAVAIKLAGETVPVRSYTFWEILAALPVALRENE
jgi:hypothetical protein